MIQFTVQTTDRRNHGVNDSTTAFRAREQLRKFLGIFSPHFPKRTKEFLGQMFFGIQAARDTLISEIAGALREDCLSKKTQERLERHLAKEGLAYRVHQCILEDVARAIGPSTLVILDGTDIQKAYAERMEHLAKVWDGSEGKVGEGLGYTCCMAVACENGCRRIIPLHMRLWSSAAPDFVCEHDEVQQAIMQIALATDNRGIYVYDRGGDSETMFRFYVGNGLDFIVRLVGDRNLVDWGRREVLAESLAEQCPMRYEDSVEFRSHGKVRNVRVRYGSLPVRLPFLPDVELRMVVVRWPARSGRPPPKPMMLLTTLNAARSRTSLWEVVQGYMTRWRVEDTIRYVKQSYRLEHMRMMRYGRLRNMAAIVAAVAYFAAAWIGRRTRLNVLAEHVAKMSRRMMRTPDFFYYALADGLRWLFVSHGRWTGADPPDRRRASPQMELALSYP